MKTQSTPDEDGTYLPNPLNDFETYSVHYVMLACRTTVTAKDFVSDDPASAASTLAAVEAVTALGDPVVLNGNSKDVFLMLDTRRFSQFTVEHLKYDVLINGLQNGGGVSNLAVDLSMTVLDSSGISFSNYMQWLMDTQLKANFDGIIFLLRTIFVGHKSDGETTVVQSETIPLHLHKMEIDLNFAKGAYNLEFMPNMNFDVNRYAKWLSVSLATGYTTGPGCKLGSIVASLEDQLNKKSEKYFNDVQIILQEAKKRNPESNLPTSLGRKVQYMITIPANWENMEVLGATPGGASEIQFFTKETQPAKSEEEKKTEAEAKKLQVPTVNQTVASGKQLTSASTSVKPSLIIPKVLDQIFKQTPEVAALGNFRSDEIQGSASVTFFKYVVGLTSDDAGVIVHVDVVEFNVPRIFTPVAPTTGNTTSVSKGQSSNFTEVTLGNGVIKRIPNNVIKFDYIFTGKNSDILNFDMKIQDFQFLLASNLRMGDHAMRGVMVGQKDSNPPLITELETDLMYARKFDPIIMPHDTEAATKNLSQYTLMLKSKEEARDIIAQTQRYTKNLSMFYAGSPITVELTIRGNPLIMHKFNMGSLMMHPDPGSDTKTKQENTTKSPISSQDDIRDGRTKYRAHLEEEILRLNKRSLKKRSNGSFESISNLDQKSYAISPVFCKINVMGPNTNFKTGELLSETDSTQNYAASALNDNYYVIFRVTNQIQGHNFTQNLELYAHNLFGHDKLAKSDNNAANAGTFKGSL